MMTICVIVAGVSFIIGWLIGFMCGERSENSLKVAADYFTDRFKTKDALGCVAPTCKRRVPPNELVENALEKVGRTWFLEHSKGVTTSWFPERQDKEEDDKLKHDGEVNLCKTCQHQGNCPADSKTLITGNCAYYEVTQQCEQCLLKPNCDVKNVGLDKCPTFIQETPSNESHSSVIQESPEQQVERANVEASENWKNNPRYNETKEALERSIDKGTPVT